MVWYTKISQFDGFFKAEKRYKAKKYRINSFSSLLKISKRDLLCFMSVTCLVDGRLDVGLGVLGSGPQRGDEAGFSVTRATPPWRERLARQVAEGDGENLAGYLDHGSAEIVGKLFDVQRRRGDDHLQLGTVSNGLL